MKTIINERFYHNFHYFLRVDNLDNDMIYGTIEVAETSSSNNKEEQ